MPDVFVQSFTHLKDRHNADKALEVLKKIASLVKPIMRKHSWVLPVLAEFFPDNPNLLGLNVNMGQKIIVRLRPAHSPDSFLTQDDLVQTMLHELTHNVHGPHDDKFYKFLASLQDEYDALQRSGYAGEGFFSDGIRLGSNISHNVPPHIARLKALEAAEKRKQTSRVLGGGGRLGGSGRNAGLTPRELAARAAEQRARDEKSCASGAVAQREAEKAAKESIENKVIDLTSDDDMHHHSSGSDSDVMIVEDVHPRPRGFSNAVAGPSKSKATLKPRGTFNASHGSIQTSLSTSTMGNNQPGPRPERSSSIPTSFKPINTTAVEWSCPACTLLNPACALQCDACQMRKPLDDRQGWSCLACDESGISHEFWSCRRCGTIKVYS